MKGTALYDYSVARGLIDPETHVGDLSGCCGLSTLTCFTDREKKIRYNIFLLGAVAARLPFPLHWLVLQAIRFVPPNRLFARIRHDYYRYSIENKIFNLHWRRRTVPTRSSWGGALKSLWRKLFWRGNNVTVSGDI